MIVLPAAFVDWVDRACTFHDTLVDRIVPGYYHRLNPPQGFAFQRVYTDDRSLDEACAVENHDVVMVPRGYHPVGMPAGYDGYYLNVMAGPGREWRFTVDPDHAWLMDWTPTTGPDDTTERPR